MAIKLDAFERAFFECALWSTNDESAEAGGNPLDETFSICDIADETLLKLMSECHSFREANADLLEQAGSDEQNGHDFWLSRNGHGAGFFDRGYGDVGEKLQAACGWRTAFGEVNLYIGDDGKIYC